MEAQVSLTVAFSSSAFFWSLVSHFSLEFLFFFIFMHLADAFIQSDLQLHSGYTFFISMCVPWESNPQPVVLLTQCSTTEPHRNTQDNTP